MVRVLLVADTHLGYDLPLRPRVERRRRGQDFLANFRLALEPALKGDVDLVVHGGDLFHRSKVPPALIEMAMEPMVEVANSGVPVFIVPGNHERSRIPLHLWVGHPNINIFDRPWTFHLEVNGVSVALAGFPCRRNGVRDLFRDLLRRTRYQRLEADMRLLCLHQTVEGAQVGPSDYTFRYGEDIVRGRNIPGGFAGVLCGHIHRSQMLTHDLRGLALSAPVIYPGSVERTAFAERFEEKHYVIAEFVPTEDGKGHLADVSFVPLPSRPMHSIELDVTGLGGEDVELVVKEELAALEPDSVVRFRVQGDVSEHVRSVLEAAKLRELAPPSMNVTVSYPRQVKTA